MGVNRIVFVTKPTPLEELIRLHHYEGAARFVLESEGQSIESYRREAGAYAEAILTVKRQLPNDILMTSVLRDDLPDFLFRESDLVIACGPDGLFANLAKYLGDQPVLPVNPDPRTVAGVIMRFAPKDVGQVIAKVREGTHRTERLPFVKASVGESVVWGVNDVFLGRKDHVSARYEIAFDGDRESQSSSGVIISTGLGSTGWIRSIAAMIEGIAGPGTEHALCDLPQPTDDELVFVVREPFKTPTTGTSVVTGRIFPNQPLAVVSQMPRGGFIFSDGVVEKAVEWPAGSTVTVSVGDRYVQRIVQ